MKKLCWTLHSLHKAHSKEKASSSAQSSSSRVEEDQRVMNATVMSTGKGAATVLTVLGKDPHPPAVQYLIGQAMRFLRPDRPAEHKAEDSVKPVHEDKGDAGSVNVDYEDSSDEGEQPALGNEILTEQALRNGQLPLEQSALRDPLSIEQLALSVEPTTALVQEPPSELLSR